MKNINWGIIGLGNIASIVAESFKSINNCKLKGISSKNINRLNYFKKKFNIEESFCFNNYSDLINCSDIDIVYIALPNNLHYQWIIECIKANKNILVEKPALLNSNQVLDINLFAGYKLIQGLMRGMMKRRWGRIIGISSVVGTTGNPGQANYAAAKAGMIGFSKALAQEVATRGITVNVIAPGMIQTAMTDDLNDEQSARLLSTIPLGRLGSPDEIAASVIYLASDEAAYVTGVTLHVNGGMAMY